MSMLILSLFTGRHKYILPIALIDIMYESWLGAWLFYSVAAMNSLLPAYLLGDMFDREVAWLTGRIGARFWVYNHFI